ncbi:MAG: lipid-A-disaccharide synthase-related protein [Synechococcus lacustris]
MTARLLVLSNGHGEDLIAARILEPLQRLQPQLQLSLLPLVGQGGAFNSLHHQAAIQRLGPLQALPSGGFSNQSLRGLLQDLGAGLAGLSLGQWRSLHRWRRGGGAVLAVGDLLPLLLAAASGLPYGFIGTPKSDYTWRSGPGRDPLPDAYHRLKGSEWDPWEWALMGRRQCRLVICRDGLTARGLRRHGVAALAPGNPMMDGFNLEPVPACLAAGERILLLPGSRCPEALGNLQRLLGALPPAKDRILLLACGSRPSPEELAPLLAKAGYGPAPLPGASGAASAWRGPAGLLLVGPGLFGRWGPWAQLGLACAGTATEQLVGLGIPALSLPGPGPQFKAGFARRQSRLLGGAVQVCNSPSELAKKLELLLAQPSLRAELGAIGKARMGPAGGSERIAALIQKRLLLP